MCQSKQYSRYTVAHDHDCIVVRGQLSDADRISLLQRYDTGTWLIDDLLAAHLQVAMVLGPQQMLEQWRAELGVSPQQSAIGRAA